MSYQDLGHSDEESSVLSEPSTPIVRRARTLSGTRVDTEPCNLEGVCNVAYRGRFITNRMCQTLNQHRYIIVF